MFLRSKLFSLYKICIISILEKLSFKKFQYLFNKQLYVFEGKLCKFLKKSGIVTKSDHLVEFWGWQINAHSFFLLKTGPNISHSMGPWKFPTPPWQVDYGSLLTLQMLLEIGSASGLGGNAYVVVSQKGLLVGRASVLVLLRYLDSGRTMLPLLIQLFPTH
jgi:hypothetical protein